METLNKIPLLFHHPQPYLIKDNKLYINIYELQYVFEIIDDKFKFIFGYNAGHRIVIDYLLTLDDMVDLINQETKFYKQFY